MRVKHIIYEGNPAIQLTGEQLPAGKPGMYHQILVVVSRDESRQAIRLSASLETTANTGEKIVTGLLDEPVSYKGKIPAVALVCSLAWKKLSVSGQGEPAILSVAMQRPIIEFVNKATRQHDIEPFKRMSQFAAERLENREKVNWGVVEDGVEDAKIHEYLAERRPINPEEDLHTAPPPKNWEREPTAREKREVLFEAKRVALEDAFERLTIMHDKQAEKLGNALKEDNLENLQSWYNKLQEKKIIPSAETRTARGV